MSDLDLLLNASSMVDAEQIGEFPECLVRYSTFKKMHDNKDRYTFGTLVIEMCLALSDLLLYKTRVNGYSYVRSTAFKTLYRGSGLTDIPEYFIETADFILDKYYNWPDPYGISLGWREFYSCVKYLDDLAESVQQEIAGGSV